MNLGSVITQSTIGVALIVSNDYKTNPEQKDLPETQTDAQKMTEFLKKCKYKVFCYPNLSKDSFVTLYEEMAQHKYPKTCRRLIVYFSGHGGDGTMLFQDGEEVNINDMVTSFKPVNPNAKNETLGNTVRMFFIDACRGDQDDYGYLSSKDATPTIKHITKLMEDSSNDTNILVAYATTPQYASYIKEEKGNGSVWTYYLLKELEKSHIDILVQLRNVNKAIKHKKIYGECYQIGETVHTLAEDVNFKREAGLDQHVTGFFKESMKGGGRGAVAQLPAGTTVVSELITEASKKITGQGMKSVATQATKATVKQAAKLTTVGTVAAGLLVVEGVCWGYEIKCAHNKKKSGEITKEQFQDICVEQTATSGGSVAGGLSGSFGGAAIGTAVGSVVVPGLGSVIGLAIGGFIGGASGGLGGSLLGKAIGKVINKCR